MKSARLIRSASTPYGVFGQLWLPDGSMLHTLERLWKDNQRDVSCILPEPGGKVSYRVERDQTGRHRYYRILNIPGRSNIELHTGNLMKHSRGCPLLGRGLTMLEGQWAVKGSRLACQRLVEVMGDEAWDLEISWSFEVSWG
jgi:hypothetical protein